MVEVSLSISFKECVGAESEIFTRKGAGGGYSQGHLNYKP